MQCEVVTPDPAPPSSPRSNAAGWWLLGFMVVLLLIDYTLYRKKKDTFSQWLRRVTRGPLVKILSAVGLGLLLWHLFWGGPL